MSIEYVLQELDGSKPYQTFRATLDNRTYELAWQWNTRGQFWTCGIGFVGEDPIVKYKVTNWADPMLCYGYNEDLPQGKLLVYSFVQPDNRVTQTSIGQDNMHSFAFTVPNS